MPLLFWYVDENFDTVISDTRINKMIFIFSIFFSGSISDNKARGEGINFGRK